MPLLTEFAVASPPVPASPARPARAGASRTFSAVSLNIAKESDPGRLVRAIRNSPRLRDADLYLLQEVRNADGRPSVADEAARELGHDVSFAAASSRVHDQGLAILSRYPLARAETTPLKACDLRFRSRFRFAMAATVRTPWGDLRAWNVHLDTRINPKERLEQLQPVIDIAARHAGPRLIGGDFNTNGMYWLGNVVPLPCPFAHRKAIRGAMKRHGFETPLPDGLNTFPLLRRHLDWIFLNGLTPLSSSVVPVAFSDHNAVWIRSELPPSGTAMDAGPGTIAAMRREDS